MKTTNLSGYNRQTEAEARRYKKAMMSDEELADIRAHNDRKELADIAALENKLGHDLSVPKAEHIPERPIIGYSGTTASSAFQPATIQPIYGSNSIDEWF